MCKDNKKCKACAAAQIGKTMAKKSRKSSKSLIIDGLYITGGVVAGGYAVPKVVEMLDPTGKLDPKLTQGAAAAAGFFGAMNTKGEIQKVMLGVGIGAAANLFGEVIGMGYVVSPSYDVNRIIGAGDDFRGTTGLNPGDI